MQNRAARDGRGKPRPYDNGHSPSFLPSCVRASRVNKQRPYDGKNDTAEAEWSALRRLKKKQKQSSRTVRTTRERARNDKRCYEMTWRRGATGEGSGMRMAGRIEPGARRGYLPET